MSNVVVIGSQWGDEGKGKIVDWLSEKADVVARFQGGHNAGHTLVVNNITYKLKLLPSGIVRKNKISIIGNGVVIDPWALLDEIKQVKKLGIKITNKNLYIAENATLILPQHKELDGIREDVKNIDKIGTTRRGIGPAYEDKVGRRAIRVMDLANKKNLSKRIDMMLFHHNSIRKSLGKSKINKRKLINDLTKISSKILKYSKPVWKKLEEFKKKKKIILFEGAQGVLLDVDHGTYPFVTSSNTVAGEASAGTGCGPNTINYILGIVKAYTTRVGEGSFPTELKNEIGNKIGRRGKEFGTVTNRKRRCGWFDAVLVKQSCAISGINGIALTKIDVLDEFKNLYICVAYRLNGKKIDYFPSSLHDQIRVQPIYKRFDGWLKNTKGIKKWKNLPKNAKKYINFIKNYCGVKMSSISTSPKREDTILLENPFK
ncbi:MAG TPA: adenylosuccinate synthase [Pelagibacteraceae bacterium]|nr:adenylosuccinate synthase [Pelagibacteraceae bacterium]HIO51568.1 adenylosuccinate synthase [Pelagibacteraceae bacterium]